MKKKTNLHWVVLIGLCLVLNSCSKEDKIEPPLIGDVKSDYTIYTDENVELCPNVTSEDELYYLWTEDAKELSKEPKLKYSSQKAGMHLVVFTATNRGGKIIKNYNININKIPLAEINTNIPKEGINLKNGEEKLFQPEIKTIRECTYEWEENKISLSKEKDYKYSSTTTGLHKIVFKAKSIAGIATDTIKINISPIPSPIININIPEGGFSTVVGKPINIKLDIISEKEATITWYEGENELSKEKTLNHTFYKAEKHTITIKAINEGGTTIKEILVSVNPSYGYGTFVVVEGNMSDQNGRLCYIDNDGNFTANAYYQANKTYVGNVFQDIYIHNGEIYMLTQNGDVLGGDGRLVIADAYTMEKKRIINTGEINNKEFWPQHLVVINNNKAYIRYSTSDMEQNSGIRILDIPSGNLSTYDIEGTYGKFTTEGSTKIRMLYTNNLVFAPCGYDLCIIDPSIDKVIKRIKYGRQIKGIVKGHDGNIWMTLAGTYEGNQNMGTVYTGQSSVIGIDVNDFHTIKEYKLTQGFNFPVATWTPGIGMCASFTENAIFFWNGPFRSTQVYRFDYTNGKITELINIKKEKDLRGCTVYGYLGVDINDNLYISATNYMSSKIIAINTRTGTRKDLTYLKMDNDKDNKYDNYYYIDAGSPSGIDFTYRFY